jgi:hypothetical protein
MKWWLVYLVLGAGGEWDPREGYYPREQPDKATCMQRGYEWDRSSPILPNEALACIREETSELAISKMRMEIALMDH